VNQRLLATSLVAGALAIGLAACGAAPTTTAPAAAAQTSVVPLATVVPAPTAAAPNITLGISGIGEIKAAQDADLVFQAQGTVATVSVKEGAAVKKGDLLAILDMRAFDQQLHQAEAALANAKAQQDGLTQAPRKADAAAAAAQVRQAQAQVTAVRQGAKDPDRAQVQAGLNSAQINLQSTKDRLSLAKTQADVQVEQGALALTQAQARYAQAKEYWQTVQDTGNDPIVPSVTNSTGKKTPNKLSDGQRANYYSSFVQAEAALHQSEQSLQLAQQSAEGARQGELNGIAAAEQQLVQAQATSDKLNLPPDSAQLSAAQAALAQALAAQARLTQAPLDAQTAAAAAGVAQAQAALELAQITREHAEIRAPFDGVVAQVNVDPGDPSTTVGKPAIKVVDVSALHLDAQISDIDIGQVTVGQATEVRADARPDTIYKGKVSYIAPTATTSGSIRTYLVRVTLDNQAGLLAGMSARVDLTAK